MKLYDFHTHSFASDGSLSRVELIRRAHNLGYRAIAVTDHVADGDLEQLIKATIADCQLASKYMDIIAIPGVELTHVPPQSIDYLAKKSKELGAKIVIVHGETMVEPVISGTNSASVKSGYVDILAHPGLISEEDARVAKKNGIFVELSLRKGHCITNGYIANISTKVEADIIVNTDAHEPSELLTGESATYCILGAGLDRSTAGKILTDNPKKLLSKLNINY